jgi:hypothetical protein
VFLQPTLDFAMKFSYLNKKEGRDIFKGGFKGMDQGLIKQINQRLQEEMLKKEIALVQYSCNELERILEKRYQDMAGLLNDVKGLVQKYHNRLKILKTSRIN